MKILKNRIVPQKRLWTVLCAGALLCVGSALQAKASDRQDLPSVKPVASCERLAKAELDTVAGAQVAIASAAPIETPQGQFCKVLGNIAPGIGFEVDLPMERWTQRYLETGCGYLCGVAEINLSQAGSCTPALNGEFAVASNDLGHKDTDGTWTDATFGADPQKRIDFAYRANHLTTVVAKELIKNYYGQPVRYSYFMGCSDGGREALVAAQRFPEDFDGISAGAPAAIFQLQNTFYHGWNTVTNRRADGTNILLKSRLKLLHDAVIAHCPTLSGVNDGVLEDPRACGKFDPAWVQCKAGAADTSNCLTAEEIGVVQRLYEGPTDAAGNHFVMGGAQLGSEAMWYLPVTPTEYTLMAGIVERTLRYLAFSEVTPAGPDLLPKFAFNQASFERAMQMAPLYNATNTNLRPFEKRGGKLILWHGWSDTSITPAISIAYYQGVQKEMGEELTHRFMRLYMLPGTGHCRNGDGFSVVDFLTPLMAWTELGRAPEGLVGKKIPQVETSAMPSSSKAGTPAVPHSTPYAKPVANVLATRTIYPYPYLARYTGKGDPNDAANFEPVRSPVKLPQEFQTLGSRMIGPDNQKFYHVENGKLVASPAKP